MNIPSHISAAIRTSPLVIGLLSSGVLFSAHAHEYWLQAHPANPNPGDTVALSAWVGEAFFGDDVPNIAEKNVDYSVIAHGERHPIQGDLTTEPSAFFIAQKPGSYVIGQHTRKYSTEMGADSFITYLKKQGLEAIIPQIKARRLEDNDAKEGYYRCAKTIVQTHPAENSAAALRALSTPMNYPLELIPLTSPAHFEANGVFKVQILFQGQPLPNIKLVAMPQSTPQAMLSTRSNTEGIASFELPTAGQWMIHGVHMIPVSRFEADWESIWANLTFSIPEA